MKLSHIFAVATALCLAALTVNAAESTARVAKLKGAARWSTDNKTWKTLSEGDIIRSGTIIQTASESWVDVILYADGVAYEKPSTVVRKFTYGASQDSQLNVIRLQSDTVLSIDRLFAQGTGADNVTETQLDLRAGRVFGNVKKLSSASKYEVKVPNGVAGIRGTLFNISANGILTVYFGSVAISYYEGSGQLVSKIVSAGERLDLNTNELSQLGSGQLDDGRQTGDDMGGPRNPNPPTVVSITVLPPPSRSTPGENDQQETPPQDGPILDGRP